MFLIHGLKWPRAISAESADTPERTAGKKRGFCQRGAIAALAIFALATCRAGAAEDAARAEFTAAIQRVRQRSPEPPDSATLKAYVIYDYLTAARFRRDLELKPSDDLDTAIDAFLQAHAGQPIARNLRNDWLTSLANRHRWDWFLPRSTDVSTPPLICDRFQARLATGDTKGLAAEALNRWSLPQKQPPECDPVFAWLRQQGLFTPALAEARTRAALSADNPRLGREFLTDVPADKAGPLLLWAQLLDNSKNTLTNLAVTPSVPVEPEALIAGFDHLARADAPSALNLLPKLLSRPDMTPIMQARLQRTAAMGAAVGRDSAAVAAFAQLPDTSVDNDVREWRVRAALWAGNYQKVLTWIDQMPPALSTQPRWKYWYARAVEATSGHEAAVPLFTELAGLRDFYGYLAADRVHRSYVLNAKPSLDDEGAQRMLAGQAGLIRARALFDCNLDDDANLEWAVVFTGADNPTKLQAAHLAARWGWYAQSISTLAQVGELDDVRLRYPRPYASEIAQASKLTQLPSDWILAVMRQESLFRDDAVSRAGARGLMQIMPSTAVAVAKRWHLPPPERDGTFDPPMDVQRGAAHLRDLLDKYGQLGLTLAAYNAGAIPVARWLPTRTMDADVWIENIPYGETRNYIQRIVEHIVAFAWVRDAEPPRLTTLLPPITPSALSAQTTTTAP
jgi:soluble lytic murein transglycosylase